MLCLLILLCIREQLSQEIDNLREDQRTFSNDLSNVQMRWHAAREEKIKASSVLYKFKKAEEDLISFAEEKSQIELDEKASSQLSCCQYLLEFSVISLSIFA